MNLFQVIIWASGQKKKEMYQEMARFTPPLHGPWLSTAAMAGTKEISFTVNLRVRVNSRKNSPFSSPFFNDPFFGFGREESLTVELPTKSMKSNPCHRPTGPAIIPVRLEVFVPNIQWIPIKLKWEIQYV